MDDQQLANIKAKSEVSKKMKVAATPGPWFIQENEDNHSMNMTAVATNSTPQSFRVSKNYDAGVVIALTLVQEPQYAAIADERWEENAGFIVHARNSDLEQDVDLLLEEVVRLRQELDRLVGDGAC